MILFCCGCSRIVDASLTYGAEIYPHRKDLHKLPFWKCDTCGNFVGCHHKTKNPTTPLGSIPTPEIRKARQRVHQLLDPLWRSGKSTRRSVYKEISQGLGYEYHTAKISTLAEADKVLSILNKLTEAERVK